MSAAFVTHVAATPGTNSSFTINITVSGTNPVLGVSIGLASATATVSSVTWSLGGSLIEIKNLRFSVGNQLGYVSVWALAAPTAGAGTLTITLSTSVPFQADAWIFSGADQITPCPVGDAATAQGDDQASLTPAPTNLVANDASTGIGALVISGSPTSVTPNQRYLDTTTAVNIETGDATGTTNVTYNFATSNVVGAITVRIAAADGGGGAPAPPIPARQMQSNLRW